MDKLPRRKNIRFKNYDYSSNGFYFITICTYNKKFPIPEHRKEIENTLLNLPTRFSGVSVDYYNIMPTHIHVILIFKGVKVSLAQVVRTFKALVSKATGEKDFWQRNYYEHVIRTEESLFKIREYIQNNPLIERIRFEQFYE
ncbi:MAG: transposase [Nitrospinae bacterium]|nr:transposase [Nitrospinota bacterium]